MDTPATLAARVSGNASNSSVANAIVRTFRRFLTKKIRTSRSAVADLNHRRACGYARGSGPHCVLA